MNPTLTAVPLGGLVAGTLDFLFAIPSRPTTAARRARVADRAQWSSRPRRLARAGYQPPASSSPGRRGCNAWPIGWCGDIRYHCLGEQPWAVLKVFAVVDAASGTSSEGRIGGARATRSSKSESVT